MLRRWFNVGAHLSLVLCTAAAAAWVLSWGPLKGNQFGKTWIFVEEGQLWIGPTFPEGAVPVTQEGFDDGSVGWLCFRSAAGRSWTSVHIPLMYLVLLTGVLPLIRYRPLRSIRRRLRLNQGLCAECGYDLVASPQRCPECGASKPAHHSPDLASSSGSGRAATASITLCAAGTVLWVLSFGTLKGNQYGVQQVFVADGRLWVGPLFPGGEEPIAKSGWSIGLTSWHRFLGARGGQWTSVHVDIWCLVVIVGLPAAACYCKRRMGGKGTENVTSRFDSSSTGSGVGASKGSGTALSRPRDVRRG